MKLGANAPVQLYWRFCLYFSVKVIFYSDGFLPVAFVAVDVLNNLSVSCEALIGDFVIIICR